MIIGDRLRELRDAKKLSQGDIEKRTGLLRCYISRVENGHTSTGRNLAGNPTNQASGITSSLPVIRLELGLTDPARERTRLFYTPPIMVADRPSRPLRV